MAKKSVQAPGDFPFAWRKGQVLRRRKHLRFNPKFDSPEANPPAVGCAAGEGGGFCRAKLSLRFPGVRTLCRHTA